MMCLKLLLLLLNLALLQASPVTFIEDGFLQSEEKKIETSTISVIHRLTDEVIPTSYDLRMVPDLEKFIFSGKVEIEISVRFSTNKIILHSKQLKITRCRLFNDRGFFAASSYKLDDINELLIVEANQLLQYGTIWSLKIEFEGVLNDNMKGFYRSSYKIKDKKYWLAVTQFETSSAREAFPCFDEPRFRTPFQITIAHYSNEKAVSNMPMERQSFSRDSSINYRILTIFKRTPPVATYLVAFMVSQFTGTSDGKIEVYSRPDASEHRSYALQQSTRLLQQMEGYIGIPHNLPKLDVVAVPDFDMGAMENWGMTTYRERFVLLDKSKPSSALQKLGVTQVIAHEFAHQWFGDLVTPAWWDYLWLNEGFARYYEYFTAAAIEPTWDLDKFFVINQVQPTLWNEIETQRAMTTSVTHKNQLDEIFDVISYSKAASIIRMFEHMVSPRIFRSALHNYLKNGAGKSLGTVVPKDLFNAFAEELHFSTLSLPEHVSISDVMKPWTENIGYPLITISRCYHHGEVTIRQTTYKSPRAPKPLPEQKWIVPLTYTTKSEIKFSNTQPTQWSFADKPTELPGRFNNSDWVLFNLQHAGYYRVNYDLRNWHLLIDQLLQDPEQIHVLNRAQLIDDSFALADDNKIDYHVPLNLIQYLPKEKEIFPLITASSQINWLLTKHQDTLVGPFLKTFIGGIIEKSYRNFGFDINEADSHAMKVGKPAFLALACKLGHKDCIDKASKEYNNNKNDLDRVQPDLKRITYCSALRVFENKQEVFDNLWKLYTRVDIVNDKITILESLSCVNDENIINKILSKLVDSKNEEIRKQDTYYIYRSLFLETSTVNGVIKFLQEKISTIPEMDKHGVSTFEDILKKVKSSVKTEEQITMLKTLEEKSKILDQTKYGYLTSLIQTAQDKALKKVNQNKKAAELLLPIMKNILHPETKNDTSTQPPQTTPSPTSGGATLISSNSIWTNLVILGICFHYGLPLLYQYNS